MTRKPRAASIVGLVALIAVAALVTASTGRGTDPPPEGWTAAEWNSLDPAKQQLELKAYPSLVGMDPQVKAGWVAQHETEGPDAESLAEAAADTAGRAYSTGVIESGQSPLDRSIYRVTNSWSDLDPTPSLQKKLLIVHAGMRLDQNNSSGQPMAFLIVTEVPWPRPSPETDAGVTSAEYRYTCRPGPLKITNGTLNEIQFVDAAGASASFSLASRTFSPSCPPAG